ncbi:DUF6082 family protein [Catenulispora yoronensis]
MLLVLLSPLALRAFEDFGSLDWARLSNIGSTYQAVGSWLAMLSLVGVAYSLVIQARRSRTDRLQHDRARHREIMRMAMDDPLYMDVWGNMTRVYPDDFDARRQYHYINMVWNYWRTSYQLGKLTPAGRTLQPSSSLRAGLAGTGGSGLVGSGCSLSNGEAARTRANYGRGVPEGGG